MRGEAPTSGGPHGASPPATEPTGAPVRTPPPPYSPPVTPPLASPLTLTPLMTGDEAETAIVSGARLADVARMELRWVLRAEHELFLRYAMIR